MGAFDAIATLASRPGFKSKNSSEFEVEEKAAYPSPGLDGSGDLDQTASNPGGAPVEKVSALGGRNLGWFGILCLNINMMIGTGIFSTGGSLYSLLGSPGLVLLFWVLGLLIALSGLAVYMEFAHIFPDRAGAEAVYLEQAYRRPKYLWPATFAFLTVVLSFNSSNAIVMAEYLIYAAGKDDPGQWLIRGIAVAGFTVAVLFVIASTKWVLRLNNLLGVLKLIVLVFVVVSGFVVLGGGVKSIPDPTAAFRQPFAGTKRDGNAIANSIIRVNFAFGGYYNALNLTNEVKGTNPMRTLRWTCPVAILIVGTLYIFATMAYFAAVPLEEIRTSGTILAGLFFTKVYGQHAGARILPALVSLSSFGNIVAVLIGHARIIREIGRQGVLPYPKVWTSTKPFGTALVPLLVSWLLTVIVIIAPPAGDAFSFIVDLQSYPSNVFTLLSFAGLFIIRRRRARAGLPRPEYRAWHAAIVFSCAISVLLLVMPWVVPTGGIYGGDVSFLYCMYCIVGLGILALCGLFWYVTIKLLPRLRGYTIVDETVHEEDGSSYNKLVKVWADGRRT